MVSLNVQNQTEEESDAQTGDNEESTSQSNRWSFSERMKEKNLPAALATSVSVSLFVAACVDPSVLRIHGVDHNVCPCTYIGLSNVFLGSLCAENGQLMAVYAALLMIFALMLELNCFIMEAGGFTYPVFVKLFRRYGILHFFSVFFIMVSAGLWFGFSEKLEAEMKDHPQYRGSKIYVDFSRAYWYMVSAATVGLFGAALNVLRIYDDSLEEDQQRLIPEELRHSYFIITRPPDNPQPPPYAVCE